MDPMNSAQFSRIDTIMIAIMKEVKVVQAVDKASQITPKNRKTSLRQMENIFVETSVELYKINDWQPILGANVDIRKVNSQFSPKNISTFHRLETSMIERAKPIN